MTCRNRELRCLLVRLARTGEHRPDRLGPVGGDPGFSCRHVENGGCRGHLGCRQQAGGRLASVATGCAVASSPEEVSSSPSPTAALPLPTVRQATPPAAPIQQTSTSGKGRLVNGWFGLRRVVRAAGGTVSAAVLSVTAAGPALAQTPPSLNQVLDAATAWLVGLLASLATLFLTVGGIRYMAGATDPGEVEKAKTALKAAAIGYALAALAPLAVRILKQIVGV
jgi:hypothetical protein